MWMRASNLLEQPADCDEYRRLRVHRQRCRRQHPRGQNLRCGSSCRRVSRSLGIWAMQIAKFHYLRQRHYGLPEGNGNTRYAEVHKSVTLHNVQPLTGPSVTSSLSYNYIGEYQCSLRRDHHTEQYEPTAGAPAAFLRAGEPARGYARSNDWTVQFLRTICLTKETIARHAAAD